jgi:Glycosyl transferase family 2
VSVVSTPAPIAVFVYNRPWHTRQTLEALRRNELAGASELFIFSDAPKSPEAVVAVRQVRDYLGTVAGFKAVNIVAREENFGLARSIIDGVSRLSEQYGRVIVLEDDLLTSSFFLEFMNAALDRYSADERVMQVAGYMFPVDLPVQPDALFLSFISSWGWATWSRAWQHFDPLAQGYGKLLADQALRRKFDLDGHYRYFRMLQAQQQGKAESWAIRWYLSVFLRQGLALYPRKTMVQNLGFDGSGVNCNISKFAQSELDATFRVTEFPQLIDVSADAELVVRGIPVARPSLTSIGNKVRGLLTRR